MEIFRSKENILWDFDGVILDSMDVRTMGFKVILRDYSIEEVEQLVKFHEDNGGLSRYVKFKYFFREIRREEKTDQLVQEFAAAYSEIMKENLTSKEKLNKEVVNFIRSNHNIYKMHIVSGSDGEELRYLCEQLGLSRFFVSIEGSPTPKIDLVSNILLKNNYQNKNTCLIGDSVNDLEAAEENNIEFYGYNNSLLKDKAKYYIKEFK